MTSPLFIKADDFGTQFLDILRCKHADDASDSVPHRMNNQDFEQDDVCYFIDVRTVVIVKE